ncbi:TPA: serine--tRNA ligase [Candidatus Micrarchaeota archaeon]|nr:serine--tRNA ligase [Candidatus Micrarchaeota archaeon]HIH30947.1 serine--tRNA ligase [Candidatus Micrarchaeota archaeon]
MLSLKLIREDPGILEQSLKDRGQGIEPVKKLIELDKKWRHFKQQADKLKGEKNAVSLKISEAKKKGEKIEPIIKKTKELSEEIASLDAKAEKQEAEMAGILMNVPNLPDKSVPVGKSEEDNQEVRKWGNPKKDSKSAKPHYEVAEKSLIDFERGAKLAGHRFVVLKGLAARLERSLVNFMLDLQVMNGYTELLPPFLVNSKTMTGTGQLPKFAEELYKCCDDDLWLIPTAEVPVTNLFAGEILEEASLPMKFCAYTPCFRREAGSYQKDIKGILRQHQFSKVELVKFSAPEKSYHELETLTKDAESVLQKLELPYRVVELCTADLGFASSKTYDIEVWLPSQDKYREISSCSNCTDFQARRAAIRFRRAGKMEFVHTLNGSGIAVGRTMIAIMENCQDESGFTVPKVLRDYMRCDRVEF